MTPKLVEAIEMPNQQGYVEVAHGGEFIVLSRDVYDELNSRSLAASDLMICGTDAIKERDEAREQTRRWLGRVTELELERDIAKGELATARKMLGRMRKAIAKHKNMIHSGEDPYDANSDLWRAYNGQGD